jgi:hypothetical protein
MSDRTQLTVQDEIDALEAYTDLYAAQYPPPQPKRIKRTNLLLKTGLILMIITGGVVSGAHTLPVFLATLPQAVQSGAIIWLVAVSVFVMIESGVVFYSYSRTRNHAALNEGERPSYVHNLMRGGMWLAFSIAVTANLYSSFKVVFNVESLPFIFDLILATMTGISAPVLMFIAGDNLAFLSIQESALQRREDERYQQALDAWRSDLLEDWKKRGKKRLGVSGALSVQRPTLSNGRPMDTQNGHALSDGLSNGHHNGHGGGHTGHTKTVNASELIRQYFEQRPHEIDNGVSDRKMETRISKVVGQPVKKSSINSVRVQMRKERENDIQA